MHRDTIAIFVFDRRRNEWAHRRLFQPANPPQCFFHLPPFQGQLMFVIDVLVNAPAATSEVRTARLDPMRRSGNNAFQFRFEKFLAFARDVCRNDFSIDDVRHKYGLAVCTRDPFPAEGDIGDLKLHSTSTSCSLSSIYKQDRGDKRKTSNRASTAAHQIGHPERQSRDPTMLPLGSASGSFTPKAFGAQDDELSDNRSVIADVRIFRFVAELRRELRVAGVDPRNIAWQQRIIALPIRGHWPEQNFEQARDVSRRRTSKTTYDAVSGCSRIAFVSVHRRNRHRDFRRGEKEIREPATEFARRSIIV